MSGDFVELVEQTRTKQVRTFVGPLAEIECADVVAAHHFSKGRLVLV